MLLRSPTWIALGLLAGAALVAPQRASAAGLPTLDGKPPLVIGHRGLPGLMPEETQPSYELAADLGTDALEEDLHLTKDCVLVARHNPWLSDNTNIADVAKTNPDVAARKRVVPGVKVKVAWAQTPTSGPADYLTDLTDPNDPKSVLKSLIVDGEDHTGDWSINDFTIKELKAWFGGTTYDAAAERPTIYNGKIPDPDLPGDRRHREGQVEADRPRHCRLSREQEPDLERRAGHRQRVRPARQPPPRRRDDQKSSRTTASTPRTRRSSSRASSRAASNTWWLTASRRRSCS